MIRVLLADDQPILRSGFRTLLDAQDDVEVVAETADGGQALELVRKHLPDIVLTDIQMPVVDGIEATRRIVADPGPSTATVFAVTGGQVLWAVSSSFVVADAGLVLATPGRSATEPTSGRTPPDRTAARRTAPSAGELTSPVAAPVSR
ncbi:response regulator transcription factor (plasmid) [Streptomyces sp. NBC_01483]|nr:response regulator transcription factor [Streptomyces sp. NBC_01483]